MDATDAAARAQDAPVQWSFHSLVVASGASTVESSARNELLSALTADTQLTAHSRQRSSYRVIRRPEVEETVRAMYVEAVRAERAAAKEAAAAAVTVQASEIAGGEASALPGMEVAPLSEAEGEDAEIDANAAALTPSAMALAFQRLVALDKQAFANAPGAPAAVEPTQPPQDATAAARIFLLADYPSTVAEAQALLLTGEAGQPKAHQSAPGVPLLPLLDGVLLVVDPMRELRERRKSVSQTDERRKSLARRISTEAKDAAAQLTETQPAVAPVFQTASPFVRDLYESAAAGGLEWSDLVFVDLACCSTGSDAKPAAELLRDLEATVATRVAQKQAFKDWVSSVKTVPLPAADATSETALATVAHYEQVLCRVYEPSVSVASVVWAMREAVARGANNGSDGSVAATGETQDSDNNTSLPEAFIDHGDDAALRLALSFDLFTKEAGRLPPHRQERRDPCRIQGERIDALEKAIWRASDLPGVGNRGRKAMPVVPRLSRAERSVLDTEFATFATSPVPRVHLTRQLLRLEELLGQPWKGKLQLRDVAESLHTDVLPQRLAAILRDGPTVFKDYDEATDSLLVAAITSTAPGRFRTTSWSARDHVRHRPALKEWHRETLPADEFLTPRTTLAATACVPLSAGQLGAVAEKCSVAFPADQSIVRMYQTPHAPAWVSVTLDGDVFGLRPRPASPAPPTNKLFAMRFYANLVDGTQLLVREGRERPKKPDGHASVTATLTSVDGRMVTACSDGTIVLQRHPAAVDDATSESTVVELHRVISGKGAVTCVMSDASRRLLFPNGDVVRRLGPNSSEPEPDPLANAHRELTVDPETNAVVETRPVTGVVVVTHTDGSRVAYHPDGTTMYTTAARSHVLISKPGTADVCIDVDVNLAAQRHSEGEKVAVTKGGLRTRSVVRATDGTQVLIQYNTKVVAEVNGRIVLDRPDGTKVVAKDSGRVEFTTRRTAATAQRGESSDDADRDELSHNRVYYFNCRDGSMSLLDHEQNQFRVDVGDGRGLATVKVDLAGVLSDADAEKYEVEPIPAKAVINDPIEPFLFVLRGDGTGRELLRPRDVHEFLDGLAQPSKAVSEVSPGTPPGPLSSPESGDWWASRSLWTVERVFVQQLRPDPLQSALARRKWFDDEKLTASFERLAIPVATAYCLVTEASLQPCSIPGNQFTVVRRLEQLRPLKSDDVAGMLATIDAWRQWQDVREANKDRFKVHDPRDAEVLAQEAAMQRKVVAAIKATRARKKAERQKQREQQRKQSRAENGSVATAAVHMETVQEGNEPQDGDPAQGEDDDELDQMFSEGSDDGSQSDIDVEVDDPDELMWTAFSQADTDDSGRLALAQVRRALVQVLGVGVTSAELTRQLHTFKQPEPFAVSFDVFVDLVHAFREHDDEPSRSASPRGGRAHGSGNQSPEAARSKQLAAGSGAEAVRSVSMLRLNPSCTSPRL